jgi:hypothetical protein
MSRILLLMLLSGLLAALGCSRGELSRIDVQGSSKLAYKVKLEIINDGYGDKPFKITVISKDLKMESQILFAEQCADVKVVPDKEYIYIFYRDMALHHFSSFQYDSLPTPMLCDIQHPICAGLLQTLITQGARPTDVCSQK